MPAMSTDPLSILKSVFGYDAFRGRQREIIDHVIAGNSAFVLMPTGGASRSATRFRRWSARASVSSCRP
jgi:superfamily II DNA helicase RecQ